MNTRLWIAAAAATSVMTIAGCASGPNQNLGTGVGAVGGALVGNAIGGIIGNQVGRNADDRNYNRQRYPQGSGYYPGNGPNY